MYLRMIRRNCHRKTLHSIQSLTGMVPRSVSGWSGMKEDVLVRPAKPEDYDAVLNIIPNMYEGADYLPGTYHSYFSDPKTHPFVGVVNGKVIAFSSCYVVDNGETAVATGARAKPQYQGGGVTAKVTMATLMAAKANYPGLKVDARTAMDSEFYDQFMKLNPKGVNVVFKRGFLQYLATRRQVIELLYHLEKMSGEQGLPAAHIADRREKQTLPEKLMTSNLFPETRFLIYNSYLPLKVSPDNFAIACSTTDVVVSDDSASNGVSFGSCMMAAKGPCPVIFFHANTLPDLLSHLKLHLHQHRSSYASLEGAANLELIFPMVVPIEKIKQSLFPAVGLNTKYDQAPREAVLVVERPLPVLKANM